MAGAPHNSDWLNRVVFRAASKKGLVESFFLKVNDPDRQRALWVRLTLFNSDRERHGETWAIWFDPEGLGVRAAKDRHAVSAVRFDPEQDGLSIADCAFDGQRARGTVAGEGFSIAYDISLDTELPPYTHGPADWFMRSAVVGNKAVSPHTSATATGFVEIAVDGNNPQRVSLDGWRGMQGHNWGKGHADYAWIHCNAFEDPGTATWVEMFVARVRMAGVLTPPFSMGRLVLPDATFRFDTWGHLRRPHSEHGPTHWSFDVSGPDGRLVGRVQAEPKEIAGLVYHNPNRPAVHCLNSKLATLELEVHPNSGAPRLLRSTKAALEVLQPPGNHGIEILV